MEVIANQTLLKNYSSASKISDGVSMPPPGIEAPKKALDKER